MLRPDDAVAGADGLDGKVCAGGERLRRLHAVRLHDVRVVLARLDVRFGQVALGVEALVGGVVLAEGVVGEEDVFGGHEGDHVVRPVHHGGGDEGEGALAEGERLSRLHADAADVAVIGGQVLLPRAGGGVHLRIFGDLENGGDAPAVVGFGVVGDDHVDLRRVDDRADAREHLLRKALFDGVDERHLFVEDEVGVVRRAFFRLVAVEVA